MLMFDSDVLPLPHLENSALAGGDNKLRICNADRFTGFTTGKERNATLFNQFSCLVITGRQLCCHDHFNNIFIFAQMIVRDVGRQLTLRELTNKSLLRSLSRYLIMEFS